MKFSWNPIYFMIRRGTSCLLSTALLTASHNRPLVLAGEQVQRVEGLEAPAASGAVGVGVAYTSVHLSFPLLLLSVLLLLVTESSHARLGPAKGRAILLWASVGPVALFQFLWPCPPWAPSSTGRILEHTSTRVCFLLLPRALTAACILGLWD